jgi:hypothetical protein
MQLVTTAMEMDPNVDPGKEIMADVDKYLSGIQVNGIDLMWVAYQHEGAKTAAGLVLPDSFKKESGIQGQVGLIVKKGPLIDQNEELIGRFGGEDKLPRVGQWAIIDTRYGVQFILGGKFGKSGRHVRITEAKMIYALIERPDWII